MILDNNWLSIGDFEQIVKNAPLFALDLVVLNDQNEVLVGRRINAPAKGWWFVLGGRVFKNETLSEAFKRISRDELGVSLNFSQAQLLGLYEHFYEDSFFSKEISTHYINATHVIRCDSESLNLPVNQQHNNYRWVSVNDLSFDDGVHKYSKVFLAELLAWCNLKIIENK